MDLLARLEARRAEMEKLILARIQAISNPAIAEDGEYSDGLRSAVSAAVGEGLNSIERADEPSGPVPGAVLSQARQAARSGVALDVVLRRYIAGYVLFSDFVVRVVEDDVASQAPLRPILRAQSARFERLVVAVTSEYTRERGHRSQPPRQRQLAGVKELLAGRPIDRSELAYELDDWHVGAIVRGDGAVSALRSLAGAADRRLLLVRPDGGTAWAWFGGRRRIAMTEIACRVSTGGCGGALVALGEPARGIEGWRLTHEQASAALRTAGRDAAGIVRYADVALLASASQDQVLARSLWQLYLSPLADGREDEGAGLQETLRAYFAAGRNVSSAASALGVSRQTVGNRLRAVEERLGRSLESCAPEVELALRLQGGGGLIALDV